MKIIKTSYGDFEIDFTGVDCTDMRAVSRRFARWLTSRNVAVDLFVGNRWNWRFAYGKRDLPNNALNVEGFITINGLPL